jgi:hypothetical protein
MAMTVFDIILGPAFVLGEVILLAAGQLRSVVAVFMRMRTRVVVGMRRFTVVMMVVIMASSCSSGRAVFFEAAGHCLAVVTGKEGRVREKRRFLLHATCNVPHGVPHFPAECGGKRSERIGN